MPKPEFTRDDLVNPDAPEAEQRLKAEHPLVRDRSYEYSRGSQRLDLYKSSLIATALDPWELYPDPGDVPEDAAPGPSLELFIKERARGNGYVADFVYQAADLPVIVYGILINQGSGLGVVELELWRPRWGYWDDYGDFIGPQDSDQDGNETGPSVAKSRQVPITGEVLRRIPIGEIITSAQAQLADRSWEEEGIRLLPGPPVPVGALQEPTRAALDNASRQAKVPARGRPSLSDEHLRAVADAYLSEAPSGPGLTRRLSARFDRPEPTIKDWVKAARERGFLAPAASGRASSFHRIQEASGDSSRPA